MRILLVEDEPMFRKGLAKMIAGLNTGWEVCGEAENGEEAQRLVEELCPDLVITDIRMPLVDGLELLQRVKAGHPDTVVIVITGFQDFQYAQSALRSGALDILVKPCSKQDICHVLDKAESVLAVKREQKGKEQQEEARRLDNTLRELFLRLPYRPDVAAALERRINGTHLILLNIPDYFPAHKRYTKKDIPLLQFAVLNIVGEMTREIQGDAGCLLIVQTGCFALFVKGLEEERLLQLQGAIADSLWSFLGLRAELYEAVRVNALEKLADLYEERIGARESKAAAGGSGLSGQSREELAQDFSDGASSRMKQQLIAGQLAELIREGNVKELRECLEQLAEGACSCTPDTQKLEALSIDFAMQETARKQLEAAYEPGLLMARIERLHECGSGKELREWLAEGIGRFLESLAEWQNKYGGSSVAAAIRYMEEHYASRQLTLADVAVQAHLSPAYFSHLFKKETGRSFVTYLIEMRMEKAKQLLAGTSLNVTEVAGVVGYDLPNYFAKLFKQYNGLTPKEYRKRHQL